MNDQIAVGVGYHFAIVPKTEVSGINLNHSGFVRVRGENFSLYKAATYEESRRIDSILDRHTEYQIGDRRIEPVIMSGTVEMAVPGFDKDRDAIMFGAYIFQCNGKNIPFDFDGTSWDIKQEGEKLLVSFETGETGLNTHSFLDDYYESDYQDMGLRINDITAKVLSGASGISEFNIMVELPGKELFPDDICRCGSFTIKELSFSDGQRRYPVPSKVLEDFNLTLARNNKKDLSQQISSAQKKTDKSFLTPISREEAQSKYGICVSKEDPSRKFYLRGDGSVVDDSNITRYHPLLSSNPKNEPNR